MNSRLSKPGANRRDFLRNTAFGGLVALTGTLLARPSNQTCVNSGLCNGCPAYEDCGLPRALSVKQAVSQPPG